MTPAPAALALAAAGHAPTNCARLAGRSIGGARVVSAAVGDGACRVRLVARPAAGSRIGIAVWLPRTRWSGRYVQLGTGGFAGTFPADGMAAEVRRGNATAVTDTGHVGRDGFDARWAIGHRARVTDYGYRSLAVSSRAAKAVVRAFYGTAPRWRYFVGCSNGGRQAIMAAARDPAGWDGVLAGAPAVAFTAQFTRFAEIARALDRPGGRLSPATLPVIQAATRAACGTGQASCTTVPERVRCAPGVTVSCLSERQMATLRLIARDFDPRYAAAPDGWDRWMLGADPAAPGQRTFAEQFFGAFVRGRPGWRVADLTAADLAGARRLSPVLDTSVRRLGPFRARGGRLLVYVGTADPVLAPRRILADFARAPGADFARLYRVPGMAHCQGGAAPAAFGQAPVAPAVADDPTHDIRRTLEAWVERRRAPGRLVAVTYRGPPSVHRVVALQVLAPVAPAAVRRP